MPSDKQDHVRDIVFGNNELKDLDVVTTPVEQVTLNVDDSANGPARNKARRFVDMLNAGVKPGEAAERIGTTLRAIRTSEDMKKAVKELVESSALAGEVRREAVKAGLNKLFMENVVSDDPKAQKIALEAAKLISAQEDLHSEGGEVVFNMGELGNVIKDVTIDLKPTQKTQED